MLVLTEALLITPTDDGKTTSEKVWIVQAFGSKARLGCYSSKEAAMRAIRKKLAKGA